MARSFFSLSNGAKDRSPSFLLRLHLAGDFVDPVVRHSGSPRRLRTLVRFLKVGRALDLGEHVVAHLVAAVPKRSVVANFITLLKAPKNTIPASRLGMDRFAPARGKRLSAVMRRCLRGTDRSWERP